MSQLGKLVFFTRKKLPDPKNVFRHVLRVMGATGFVYAHRSIGEDHRWDDLTQETRSDPTESEEVGQGMSLDTLHSLYQEPCSLTVLLKSCAMSDSIMNAVWNGIPPEVRGNHCPTDPYVTLGYHDIVEDAEHESGFLFGRAFLSIFFFGYNTPMDWELFREHAFSLSAVKHARADLEAVVGPLEQCAYWSV